MPLELTSAETGPRSERLACQPRPGAHLGDMDLLLSVKAQHAYYFAFGFQSSLRGFTPSTAAADRRNP